MDGWIRQVPCLGIYTETRGLHDLFDVTENTKPTLVQNALSVKRERKLLVNKLSVDT
jgi:hypothetical protein